MPDHIDIDKNDCAAVTQKSKTATSISPDKSSGGLKVGDEVTGFCLKSGLIKIKGCDYMVPIVGDVENVNLNSLLRKVIKVKISRMSNGIVTQASYISVL